MQFTRNLITATILLQAASAFAANVPDAGQSIRILEPENRYKVSDFNTQFQAPASEKQQARDNSGPAIHVSRFEVTGYASVAKESIDAILKASEGKELTLGEIQDVADMISLLYHKEGYFLAKAYLPKQEIVDGKVKIQILEGQYDQVQLNNTSRASDSTINRYLADLKTDDVVEREKIERKMLLISDLPEVEVKSTLKPGTRVGTTSLDVDTTSKGLVTGYIDADNYGNKYTGTNRAGVTLNVNNPLGIGDQLTTRVMSSEDEQKYGRIAYQAPIGGSGLQVGASFSEMNYRLGKEFSSFDAKGNSRISSVYALYPLVRARQVNISTTAQFDHVVLKDDVDLFDSKSKKTLNSITLGLSGSAYDAFLGGGMNSFSVNYHAGQLDIQSADVREIDDLSAKANGRYTKIDAFVARTQRLTDKLNLTAKLSGQVADNNLDSSEKFDIGGAQAVRAFKQGDSSGDNGWLANLDLRYSLTDNVVLSSFYDYGYVRYNQDPWDSSDRGATRSGAGVGVDFFGSNWKVSMVGAWKTGGSTESEPDSHQFWVQLVKAF